MSSVTGSSSMFDLGENVKDVLEIHKHIVFTLLYLFTRCVLWWFGTRNKQPQPKARAG